MRSIEKNRKYLYAILLKTLLSMIHISQVEKINTTFEHFQEEIIIFKQLH